MAVASIVSEKSVAGNAQVDMIEMASAAMTAASKALDKESRREALVAGSTYKVDVQVAARVNDGQIFRKSFTSIMSVGHDSTVASSSAAPVAEIVALILEKLNPQTREAILRDLPNEFAEAGNVLPSIKPSTIEAAEKMLSKMRSSNTTNRKGSVSVKSVATQLPLNLFTGE